MSFLDDLIAKGKDLLSFEQKDPTETESVKRNSFDRADFQQVLTESPVIQGVQRKLEQTVDYADDFLADLHAGLFKVEPSVRSASEMAPTHVANRAVMEQMLSMPEVRSLRQHSTGDAYSAAMSMVAIQDTAVETLKRVHSAAEEARQEVEDRIKERKRRAEDIQKQIEDLQNNPPLPPPPPVDPNAPKQPPGCFPTPVGPPPPGGDPGGPGGKGPGGNGPVTPGGTGQGPATGPAQPDTRPGDLQKAIDEMANTPVPSNAPIQQAADQAAEGFGKNLRDKLKEATDKLDEEEDLMRAFGVEDGELQRMSVAERMALAKQLANNRLAQFAKLLGQFKAVQQAESRKRVTDAASEIHGITVGDDLTRMSTSELLNFADPALETLMWARWAEQQMSIYDVRGKENMGQGPIICVVDESGSMDRADVAGGTREAWSKALALALCDQAKRRKRDFVYIGFSSARQQHVIEFPAGTAPISKVIEMTESFFCGGTNFEEPLKLALMIIEQKFDALGKARPDVVFITDDEYGGMDPDFMHEWNRIKDKTSLKCYGIAVGCEAGGALTAVSDNVREITELTSDPKEVGDVFRTI